MNILIIYTEIIAHDVLNTHVNLHSDIRSIYNPYTVLQGIIDL